MMNSVDFPDADVVEPLLLPPMSNEADDSTSSTDPAKLSFWQVWIMTTPESERMVRASCRSRLQVMCRMLFLVLLPMILLLLVVGPGPFVVLVFSFPILSTIFWWRFFREYGPLALLRRQVWWAKCIYGEQTPFEAVALYRLGKLHEMLNEPQEALKCYQTITAFRNYDNFPHAAPYHHKVGQLLFHLGRYEESQKSFEEALRLRNLQPKQFSLFLLAKEVECIALTHEKLGNFENAIEQYSEGLQLFRDRGFSQTLDAARFLSRIGSTYETMGDNEKALEYLREALDVSVSVVGEFPWTTSIANLYEKIGNIYRKQGDLSLALDNFREALVVHRRGGKSDEHRDVMRLLGKVADLESECNV